MKTFGFPRKRRLCRPSLFQRVYRQGANLANRRVALYVLRMPGDGPRIGIAAGKRLGKAVVRNRVRRRLREVARAYLPGLPAGVLLILVARQAAVGASVAQLGRAVEELLVRSGLRQEGGPVR